jgi:HK97 family phage portal protein
MKKTAPKRAPRRPAAGRKKAPQLINLRGLSDGLPFGVFSTPVIGPQHAIQVTAILACVRFLAQAIASMPGHVIRTLPNGRKQPARDLPVAYVLGKRPNAWQSWYDWVELTIYHAALYGNAFSRIMPGERGFCSELRPLHPTRVEVVRLSDYSVGYKYLEANGSWTTFDQSQILHVRWLSDNGLVGMVPAELCSTSVALARKLDTAATSFWDNSARPDLVLETQEQIPPEAVEALRRQMREIYGGASKRGSAAVLPKKVTLKPIESNSNEANQFMELRASIIPDVARAYGVPSTLIGDSQMARWSNVEQEFLTAQVFCLLPWQKRIEGAVDRTILSTYQDQGDDLSFKLDNRGLLRGDTASRVQLYQSLWNMGAISPNEVRDLEDLELLSDPAADQTFVQLGFSTLGAAAAQAAQAPAGGQANASGA